ncbi:MAG TPA: carbohydrate ABC transporter permease [Trueperaceae bacterium]
MSARAPAYGSTTVAASGPAARASAALRTRVDRREGRPRWRDVPRFVLLCVLAVLFLAPIYWMVTTSLKSEADTVARPVQWWPHEPTLENYRAILEAPDAHFARWTFNSLFTSLAFALGSVALAVITAYPLSRMRFRGRTFWFWVILASMMIPGIIFLIPHYLMMIDFGWVDTYHALIWPGMPAAFGVFLMRQFFVSIPRELEEAARLDGANSLQVLWYVLLPFLVAPMATLGLFQFMASWNNYVWPLFVVHGEMQTLPVAITTFSSRYWTAYGKLMAGTAIASLPVLIAFLFAQRYFIRGMSLTGLKDD